MLLRTVILISLFFLLTIPVVSAQRGNNLEDSVTFSSSNYTLPFPGMLPDNPFYTFKVLRDRIILFLINDSVKKAKFYLLQADKRLQAGVYLWNQKPEKRDLAVSTISKGENYFEEAISQTRLAKKEGRDVGTIKGDLEQAAIKHAQVLANLLKNAPKEKQEELVRLRNKMELFAIQVKQIE